MHMHTTATTITRNSQEDSSLEPKYAYIMSRLLIPVTFMVGKHTFLAKFRLSLLHCSNNHVTDTCCGQPIQPALDSLYSDDKQVLCACNIIKTLQKTCRQGQIGVTLSFKCQLSVTLLTCIIGTIDDCTHRKGQGNSELCSSGASSS